MAENSSNLYKIIFTLSLIVIVVIVGVLAFSKPLLTYKTDMQESLLDDLNQKDAWFYPWQLTDVLNENKKHVILFDIRNDYDYGQGHIPGAENIPVIDLTQKNFIKRMKNLSEKNITVVLYGKDQLQANGPWMLFRQVGFNNVKVLLGGYNYYIQHKDNLAATQSDSTFLKGTPMYDYAELAAPKDSSNINQTNEKKPVEIRRRKKTTVVAGGC